MRLYLGLLQLAKTRIINKILQMRGHLGVLQMAKVRAINRVI